jgi:hypothetical protein
MRQKEAQSLGQESTFFLPISASRGAARLDFWTYVEGLLKVRLLPTILTRCHLSCTDTSCLPPRVFSTHRTSIACSPSEEQWV